MIDERTEWSLLQLAVREGLITEAEAENPPLHASSGSGAGEAEGQGGGDPRAEWGERLGSLIADGRLRISRVQRLLDELSAREPTLVEVPWAVTEGLRTEQAARHREGRSSRVAAGVDWNRDTADPGGGGFELDFLRGWDRYEIVGFLGAGGMGRVYKAWDPALKRHVALKFLRWSDARQVERFLREARAQARVMHDNVCKVFEVGRVEGHPYIAMQLIEGEPVDQAGDLLTTEQKVRIVRFVALAVQAAHRQGLIHRDLKPANILLEKHEFGWRPFVVDFGLAQDQMADALTRTGSVTGTPAYLSPEQARADTLDRRSDIYSLGVVLYELLSGRVPLTGGTMAEALIKVVNEEPEPLHKVEPSLPHDLTTIVMKCLEKEPQRRYGSARALADDLDRFLDGEPIEARRPSVVYRTGKWVRKNRVLATVVALAVVAIAVVAGVGAWRVERRAEAARQFGQEVSSIESEMRQALQLPLHDTTPYKARVEQRMAGIEREMERLGGSAVPAGHLALGRGHLALRQFEPARRELERALELGARGPELAAALGLTLGALYQKKLLDVATSTGDELEAGGAAGEEPELELFGGEYDRGTLVSLRDSLSGADRLYFEALIAFHDRDYETARQRAAAAMEARPWFYEAAQLAAQVQVEHGRARYRRGDFNGALAFYRQAGETYRELLQIARSDAWSYASDCRRLLQILTLDGLQVRLLEQEAEAALERCDQALTADPELAEAFVYKAEIYLEWARHRFNNQSDDPREQLHRAIEAADAALALDPREVLAHFHKGEANLHQATWLRQYNLGDPEGRIQEAIASFERGVAIQPHEAELHHGLGAAYSELGRWLGRQGPAAAARRGETERLALASYRRAATLDPTLAGPPASIGRILWEQAEQKIRQREDPEALLKQAVEALDRSIALNPNLSRTINLLANVQLTRAEYQLDVGVDPRPALEQAVANYRRALDLNPDYPYAHFNLGWAHRLHAEFLLASGGSVAEAVAEAEDALIEAERLRPTDVDNHAELGRVRLIAARRAMRAGEDPGPVFSGVEEALGWGFAVEVPAGADALHLVEAELWRWRGEHALAAGRAVSPAVARGLAAAERALVIDPNLAEAEMVRGHLHHLAARVASSPRERLARAGQAGEAFRRAIELSPNLAGDCGQALEEVEALTGLMARR